MKKNTILCLFLCLSILLTAFSLPVSAAQGTNPDGSDAVTVPTSEPEPEFGTVSILEGCRTIEGMAPLAGSDRKLPSAQAAFLYEVSTGTVVYSYNPDVKMEPGSLAKIVNAAVVMEHCQLDDVVTVTSQVNRVPKGAIHADIKNGEELTVKQLLNCLLVRTGNDAAIALAVHVAGNQQTFLAMMNQWVQRIGCTGTEFGNVHGLADAESTTTARDMVKIMIAASQNEDLKAIMSTLSFTIPATNKNEERGYRTQNYMIDRGHIEDFQDERVKSGVASYNESFGASLAVTAETKTGLKYVAVVLNCIRIFDPDVTWRVQNYGNFNEMTDLLRMGFNNYKVNRIIYDGMALGQFTVAGGESDVIGMAKEDIDSVVPINAQMDNLYMRFSIIDGLSAPIEKGSLIATMQIEYLGSVLAETEVYAMGNVQKAGGNGVNIRTIDIDSKGAGSTFLSVVGTICVILLGIAALYLSFNAYMRNRLRARRRKRRAERRRNY